MPLKKYNLEDKEYKNFKNKPHVLIKKGERAWTSYIFEKRNDKKKLDKNKNFIYKVLAKEKKDGNISAVVIFTYPNHKYFTKYKVKDMTKEKYDKLIGDMKREFDKNVKFEVVYPQIS